MILRPPRSTRTDTLFPYTTLFRSPFVLLTVLLGFFMSLGNAAVFKHIPAYYPDAVGPVGGLVGMIGALGGFVLPIWFGALNDLTNLWTSCFMLLFGLVGMALIWMHIAIIIMDRRTIPSVRVHKDLTDLHWIGLPTTSPAPPPSSPL